MKSATTLTLALAALATAASCTSPPVTMSDAPRIELLGFEGCPNTPALRRNLQAALDQLGGDAAFAYIDQNDLPADDLRRGWPAPTILKDGQDLFGMPQPANPAMGCRVYPDGLPDADAIANALAGSSQLPF